MTEDKSHIVYSGSEERAKLYAIFMEIADQCTIKQIKSITELAQFIADANKER